MKRTWLERFLVGYDRRLQLLRGQMLQLRGATAGQPMAADPVSDPGRGRPTKKERRRLEAFKEGM